MRKEKFVVMFVVIVHEMDFAKKIEMHFDKFLKKKEAEDEKLKHKKFDPSKFKLVCVREIDQLDLLLTNPNNELNYRSIGKPGFKLPEETNKTPEKVNYLTFIVARSNETLLTTNECEKVIKKHNANLTLIYKFKFNEMVPLKNLTSIVPKDNNLTPENDLEIMDEFQIWHRFFNNSISLVGKQLAFENKKTISTPAGEQSLEEIPSTH